MKHFSPGGAPPPRLETAVCRVVDPVTKQEHGPYESKVYSMNGRALFKTGCPKCQEAKQRAIAERRATLDKLDAVSRANKAHREAMKSLELLSDLKRYRRVCMGDFSGILDEGQKNEIRGFIKRVLSRSPDAGNMVVVGPQGTGKTALSIAVCKAVAEYGGRKWSEYKYIPVVKFEKTLEFLERIKNRAEEDNKNRYLKEVMESGLLVLDDLGKERGTDYDLTSIFRIVDNRYTSCLPSIFTSNLDEEELENKYGAASISRVFQNAVVIKLIGKDLRARG